MFDTYWYTLAEVKERLAAHGLRYDVRTLRVAALESRLPAVKTGKQWQVSSQTVDDVILAGGILSPLQVQDTWDNL